MILKSKQFFTKAEAIASIDQLSHGDLSGYSRDVADIDLLREVASSATFDAQGYQSKTISSSL